MTSISRRHLLIASAAAGTVGLSSCSDSTSKSTTSTTEAPLSSRYSLIPVFPAAGRFIAAGYPQRLPFVIAGADGAPLDSIEGNLTFKLVQNGKPLGAPITVTPHSTGLQRSFLPIPLNTKATGVVDITTSYDGVDLDASVQVGPADATKYPQIGNPVPSVETPTTTDARGVDPICTADPQCPFHEHSLDKSLTNHRPIVLLVSTPAYCQTAICGPMLDILTKVAAGRTDIDFIHAEVYSNPTKVESIDQATSSPIVTAFDMEFEPALFGINSSGILAHRLDTIFDETELKAVLDALK